MFIVVCIKGDLGVVEVLLKEGVDINFKDIEYLLVLVVYKNNYLDVIEVLINVGVVIDLSKINFN